MLIETLTRFLIERVLGWPWTTGEGPLGGWWWRTDWGERIFHPPDFTTWEGFGMLLTALAERQPSLVVYESRSEASVLDVHGEYHLAISLDPRRALVLAALKAYGFEEEA